MTSTQLEKPQLCDACHMLHVRSYKGCDGLRNPAGAINRQIALATKEVQKRARYFPYLFPEYNSWLNAKTALAEAKTHEKQARAKWLAIKGTKS